MRLIEDNGHEYFEVGSKRWCVADSFSEDANIGSDLTSDGWMRVRGCLVKFETGWAVSIIWGNYTYSSNRSMNLLGPCPPWSEEPSRVEVMVINHEHEPGDPQEMVLGWVDAEELTKCFEILGQLPTNAVFSYSLIRPEES